MIQMQQDAIQFGNYEIFRKLAMGGMAELYLAKQRGLGGFERTIVIKCILPQYASDPHFVTMFLDEARIASQLNHPNIVQIYEIGEIDSLYYIAMEFVRGPNFKALRKALFQHGTPSYGLVAGIMVQSCAGLHHAHCATDEYGQPMAIVHRDVSPTNLILTYEGGVKLLDFGVAKAAIKEHQTKTGMVKGKYRYMSPEQILAYPIDHRSDIYALGAILYELSTGVVLFQRRTEAETIRAVYMDPIIPPSAVTEGFPPELERIVMRALERDPSLRYQTADEMRRELEQFMYTQEIYYGPLQIAEHLQNLFTRVFDLTLTGGAGNELTRSDFARFGLTPPSRSKDGARVPRLHTLDNQDEEENTSPSAEPAEPSSPSSFQAPPPRSGQHSLSVQQPGTPPPVPEKSTREIKENPFASTQPIASYHASGSIQPPAIPPPHSASGIQPPAIPHPHSSPSIQPPSFAQLNAVDTAETPHKWDTPPSKRRWLLPVVVLAVSLLSLGLLWTFVLAPDREHQADLQLQQVAQQIQQRQWDKAQQLLQELPRNSLSPQLAQRHAALEKQIQWGQDFVTAQQLYRQGQTQKALQMMRALRERSPKNPQVLALLQTWEKPVSDPTRQRPVQPPVRQPDGDEPDALDTVGKPKRPVPRRVRRVNKSRKRVNRRVLRRKRPIRRRIVRRRRPVRRNLVALAPRRVEPIRPTPPRPGLLFVPAIPMARVDVDGQLFGFTPINGKSIDPGRHWVKVTKAGYQTVRRSIMVEAGKRVVLPVQLRQVRRVVEPPPLPRLPTPTPGRLAPKPRLSFSSTRLSRSSRTLRIYISDQRGIGGNTYTEQFRELASQIEKECRRLLGPNFAVRGVTGPLQRYVRKIATLTGEELMTFYPRAIAYVIYSQLSRGRSLRRVSQLLVSYQKRKKFKRYRHK